MLRYIREMGPLRNMLHAVALLFTMLMPFSSGSSYEDSWGLFFSGILPASAPIVVIVIGLDIMMSNIWKSDASTQDIARLNRIIKTHVVIGGILLAAWLLVFLPAMVQ